MFVNLIPSAVADKSFEVQRHQDRGKTDYGNSFAVFLEIKCHPAFSVRYISRYGRTNPYGYGHALLIGHFTEFIQHFRQFRRHIFIGKLAGADFLMSAAAVL